MRSIVIAFAALAACADCRKLQGTALGAAVCGGEGQVAEESPEAPPARASRGR